VALVQRLVQQELHPVRPRHLRGKQQQSPMHLRGHLHTPAQEDLAKWARAGRKRVGSWELRVKS
jgi:hypothetical protein